MVSVRLLVLFLAETINKLNKMRNLELVQCHRIQGIPELKHASCISVDCDTGKVYLATNEGSVVCLDPQVQQVCIDSWVKC